MIQRKQSLFLFFAAAILSLTFFFPLSKFIGESDSLVLYIYKVVSLVPDSTLPFQPYFILPLLSLITLIIILSLITIFLYKNRRAQLVLVRFLLLLLLFYIGLFFFYYVGIFESETGGVVSYPYGLIIPSTTINIPTIVFLLPLVSAIFLFLASRGIVNDEKLVHSADRLR